MCNFVEGAIKLFVQFFKKVANVLPNTVYARNISHSHIVRQCKIYLEENVASFLDMCSLHFPSIQKA